MQPLSSLIPRLARTAQIAYGLVALLGASYFAAHAGRPRSARTAAALAATLGALTLIETLAEVRLGMSFEWLTPARGGEMLARMSIAACVTLLFLATVTPLARDPKVFGVS